MLKVVGLLLVAGFVALVMMRLLFRRPINATRAAVRTRQRAISTSATAPDR